jgi:hypothetical protein
LVGDVESWEIVVLERPKALIVHELERVDQVLIGVLPETAELRDGLELER